MHRESTRAPVPLPVETVRGTVFGLTRSQGQRGRCRDDETGPCAEVEAGPPSEETAAKELVRLPRFVASGYAATSIQAIAERAGVAVQAIDRVTTSQ